MYSYSALTVGDSDIDGVGVTGSEWEYAGPRAVVPVEVGLLDDNVAIVF